jgi:hypothetical protein
VKRILATLLLFVAGCAIPPRPPSAWSYYDACQQQETQTAGASSFVDMAECGKALVPSSEELN